jgi:hypothetical protein
MDALLVGRCDSFEKSAHRINNLSQATTLPNRPFVLRCTRRPSASHHHRKSAQTLLLQVIKDRIHLPPLQFIARMWLMYADQKSAPR